MFPLSRWYRGDATGARSGPPCRCAAGASLSGAVLQHTSCSRRPKKEGKEENRQKRGKEGPRTKQGGGPKRRKETRTKSKEADQKGGGPKAEPKGEENQGGDGTREGGQRAGRQKAAKPGRGPDHDAETAQRGTPRRQVGPSHEGERRGSTGVGRLLSCLYAGGVMRITSGRDRCRAQGWDKGIRGPPWSCSGRQAAENPARWSGRGLRAGAYSALRRPLGRDQIRVASSPFSSSNRLA